MQVIELDRRLLALFQLLFHGAVGRQMPCGPAIEKRKEAER
jgi:hypothetical protein